MISREQIEQEIEGLSPREIVELIQELRNQVSGTCAQLDTSIDSERRAKSDVDKIIDVQIRRDRLIVGFVLAAYGEAINRGDKLTAEVLDALATQIEHCP